MNMKQALKITLLIVILAEEIKSVGKNKNYRLNIDADELVGKLSKKRKIDIY